MAAGQAEEYALITVQARNESLHEKQKVERFGSVHCFTLTGVEKRDRKTASKFCGLCTWKLDSGINEGRRNRIRTKFRKGKKG